MRGASISTRSTRSSRASPSGATSRASRTGSWRTAGSSTPARTGRCASGEEAPPDADSVFRIASMTKSFTAATILLLRDEGRLRLDDPVARWVPELAELAGPDRRFAADHDRTPARRCPSGLPDRRPLGRPSAGPSARCVRGAAARRPVVRLGPRDPVRVLQPGLRHPRARHHRRRGRGVQGRRPRRGSSSRSG